jgi:Homeodomain-like domain
MYDVQPGRGFLLKARKIVLCPQCGYRQDVRGHAQACETRIRVVELRATGMTMAEIGRQLGVSRQRVHQILSRVGRRKKLWSLVAACSDRVKGEDVESPGPALREDLEDTDPSGGLEFQKDVIHAPE